MNCWGCYKLVGRLPQQMRLDCPVLRQVQLVYNVLRQVNQFLFGNCAPHPGASASLSPDVFRRLSVAAFAGLLRYHRSDLGDRKLHVAKSEHSKIAKCGFLLPSSSVTVSDLDRLIGKGVTLCGHACFNTTCSLESVLKGGADC